MSKAGEHLYKSTAKIINDIKEDGLHNVLADGIDHFGDTITYFTTETFMNEIGGTLAKCITIPLTTGMKALGMEEEGNEMKEWIDNGLKGMSESLDKAMTDNFYPCVGLYWMRKKRLCVVKFFLACPRQLRENKISQFSPQNQLFLWH